MKAYMNNDKASLEVKVMKSIYLKDTESGLEDTLDQNDKFLFLDNEDIAQKIK
jgi:hypothetical protein